MTNGVAIVGASDNNSWSGHLVRNLAAFGYSGEVWMVNPNYETVNGKRTYPSVEDVPGDLDGVVITVAAQRCAEIVRGCARKGVGDIVVVSDGFAERGLGGSGHDLQDELVAACPPDTRLYGPNCVGFADFHRNLCLIAEPVPIGHMPGNISIVSQSGAVVSTMMAAVLEDGGSLDWCASLGNSAKFGIAEAIQYLCDKGTTRSICIYAETLGSKPENLAAALDRARDQGVCVSVLKTGRTRTAANIALSHTASVAGDDAEVDAFLRFHGAIRVDSFDELARVSVLAPMVRSNLGKGVAVIGSSGGQAAVAVDLADRDGLKLPRFRKETMELLRENAAPGSFLDNPIDLVGRPGAKSGIGDIFQSVFTDKGIGFVLSPWSVIFPDDSVERKVQRDSIQRAVSASQRSGTPTVVSSLVVVPWTDWILQLRSDNPDVAVVRGIETTIRALSRLFPRGSVDDDEDVDTEDDAPREMASYVGLGEVEGREILSTLGLPLVRGHVVRTADEAADALSKLQVPVVVKVDVVGVAHKAKLGLVRTNCWTAEEVRRVVSTFNDRIDELGVGNDSIAGILVEEMASGTELLVGLTKSALGRFLTVGVGGVNAIAGTNARTVMLPTSRDVIQDVCAEILCKRFDASEVAAATKVIDELSAQFNDGALAAYSTVEINPMFVSGESALIADVLMERSHD